MVPMRNLRIGRARMPRAQRDRSFGIIQKNCLRTQPDRACHMPRRDGEVVAWAKGAYCL